MATRQNRIKEGSCWPCRKRRIKCDIAKPCCGPCRISNADCSYNATAPVKWVGGPAKRGRLAPNTSPPSPTARELTVIKPSLTQPLDTDGLLAYFGGVILPRFQLADEHICLNLSELHQDGALQEAVVALSHAHYALNSKSSANNLSLVRQRARISALEEFRKRLEKGVNGEVAARQLFTINILLCILDGMIEPAVPRNASVYHLKGGFAMIEKWANAPVHMLLEKGLRAHLVSIFATLDLVHALLSGEKPFFESLLWNMFAGVQAWWGCLEQDDPFLEILKAFSEMASLGCLVHSTPPSPDLYKLINKCLTPVREILNNDDMDLQSTTDPAGQAGQWARFCSIWRSAGSIYLCRALQSKPVDDVEVQIATKQGVDKLSDSNLSGMMRHCTIFPMLVIGSQCMVEKDQKAVMEALTSSASYLSFGSLLLMEKFLRGLWAQEGLPGPWWECFESLAQEAFLF